MNDITDACVKGANEQLVFLFVESLKKRLNVSAMSTTSTFEFVLDKNVSMMCSERYILGNHVHGIEIVLESEICRGQKKIFLNVSQDIDDVVKRVCKMHKSIVKKEKKSREKKIDPIVKKLYKLGFLSASMRAGGTHVQLSLSDVRNILQRIDV